MIHQEAKSLLLADYVKTEVSYLLLQIAVLLSPPRESSHHPQGMGSPWERGEMEFGSDRDGAGCTNPCGVSIWATTELMCFCVSLTRFTSGRSEIGVPCPIASLYFTCRYESRGMWGVVSSPQFLKSQVNSRSSPLSSNGATFWTGSEENKAKGKDTSPLSCLIRGWGRGGAPG